MIMIVKCQEVGAFMCQKHNREGKEFRENNNVLGLGKQASSEKTLADFISFW